VGEIAGIVVAIVFVVVIVSLLGLFLWKKKIDESNTLTQKFSGLPSEIMWSFEEVERDKQLLKLFPMYTKSYQTVAKMFYDHLEGSELIISEIYGVYSESLLNGFSVYHQNLTTRINEAANLFKHNKWIHQDPSGLRKWMMDRYTSFVNLWSWNENSEVSIIPQLHGTDFDIAKAICKTGFASLSLLDEGWYGKGIYFTHSGLYATPYYATKKNPALIIAYVIPGNVYPVYEAPKSEKSLVGSGLMGGYQAHYVVTTKEGEPVENKTTNEKYYSELVIVQEAQCVPAFILRVDISNLAILLEKFERTVVEPPSTKLGTAKLTSEE